MKWNSPHPVGCLVLALLIARGFGPSARAGEAPQDAGSAQKVPVFSGSKPLPSPTPQPSPKPKLTPNEEEEEIRANHRFLGEPARPPRTALFVGREIPVPKDYNPARVQSVSGGGVVVQPPTPRSFEVRRTGVTLDGRGGFEQTELEGFIHYSNPVRTVVPVVNEKGEVVGTAIREYPNSIPQPVFRTIRR